MKYKLLTATDEESLEIMVNERLAAFGNMWELQGGVSVCFIGDDNYLYTQAMVSGDFIMEEAVVRAKEEVLVSTKGTIEVNGKDKIAARQIERVGN